jgi:hypothetical protein
MRRFIMKKFACLLICLFIVISFLTFVPKSENVIAAQTEQKQNVDVPSPTRLKLESEASEPKTIFYNK